MFKCQQKIGSWVMCFPFNLNITFCFLESGSHHLLLHPGLSLLIIESRIHIWRLVKGTKTIGAKNHGKEQRTRQRQTCQASLEHLRICGDFLHLSQSLWAQKQPLRPPSRPSRVIEPASTNKFYAFRQKKNGLLTRKTGARVAPTHCLATTKNCLRQGLGVGLS